MLIVMERIPSLINSLLSVHFIFNYLNGKVKLGCWLMIATIGVRCWIGV